MGFGFKLAPGVRVSTRGVRIGPRYANVRVGSGGVRASVGPRIARVHVGSRGVSLTSGIGPLTVSSRGGAWVRGGIGPLRGSIGNRGSSLLLGAGPFWLGTSSRSGGRRSRDDSAGRQSAMRPLFGESRVRPNLGDAYAADRARLAAAGVKRRNQAEIEIYRVQAALLDQAPIMTVLRRYPELRAPSLPPLPDARAIRRVARAELGRRRTWRPLLPSQRRAVDEKAEEIGLRLADRRATMVNDLTEAQERYAALDPAMNLLVLQAAFADNGGTAAPVDMDGDALLVFMTFPGAKDAVWPEVRHTSPAGRPSLRKRNAQEMNAAHTDLVLCHVLATMKEAFSAQPRLARCRLIAMLERPGTSLVDLPILLDTTLDRELVLSITASTIDFESDWDAMLEAWERGPEDGKAERNAQAIDKASPTLWREGIAALEILKVHSHIDVGANRALRPIGTLSRLFPADDLALLDLGETEGHIAGPTPVAENPAALAYPEFWIQALQVAKEWTQSRS